MELEKQLAAEAKKKEAERKSTFQRIEKSSLPVVHAAEQAAKMVGANRQYVSDAKQIAKDAPEILHHNRAVLRDRRVGAQACRFSFS